MEDDILKNSIYEYDEFQGSNALILPSSKEERKKLHIIRTPDQNFNNKTESNKKKMNKRKRRKLQKLEEKKRINTFYETLSNDLKKYTLNNDEIQLMMGISNTRMTKKHKIVLIKKFEAANIEIPDFLKSKKLGDKKLISKNEELDEIHENENNESIELSPEIKENNFNEFLNNIVLDKDHKIEKIENLCTNNEIDSKYMRKTTYLKLNNTIDRPQVIRNPEIEIQRSELPVRMYEYEILDSIYNNDVTIITGATGSGKSTQLPQLLYESGYCPLRRNSPLNNKKRYLIGLTQPRRIAATSLCKRIGEELNNKEIVGYKIRYDKSNCNEDTVIKVMTDGILLQEIQKDLLCSDYSVIIIDEAHERTVNTDILIGILSKIVIFRRMEYLKKTENKCEDLLPPLKLIIMSATLRITDFSENSKLFTKPPPIINIETPNYPVTIHFCKNTPDDYILAAYKKIQLIHKKLPPGSILVFVTGKREVNLLVNMINKKRKKATKNQKYNEFLNSKSNFLLDFNNKEEDIDEEYINEEQINEEDIDDDIYEEDIEESAEEIIEEDIEESIIYDNNINNIENKYINEEYVENNNTKNKDYYNSDENQQEKDQKIDIWDNFNKRDNRKRKIRLHKDVDSSIWKGGGVIEAIEEDINIKKDKNESNHNVTKKNYEKVILKAIPLYASMNYDEQSKAFKIPESKNVRNVIISTNVSETSITIPNVRYVIDTGKEKRREYSKNSDSSYFTINWISKASAGQRAGRAGRVGPGHCYRLYSSALYENLFPEFSPIDILSIPLDSILLYMHSLGIVNVFEFPFPSPPKTQQIEKSYELLNILGCIEIKNGNYNLSNQGISLSNFPLPPRFGKILLLTTAYIRKNISLDYNSSIQLLQQVCIVVSFLTIGNLRDNNLINNSNLQLKNNFEFDSIPTNLGNDIEVNLWLCINFLKFYNSGTKFEKSTSDRFCKQFDLNFRGMIEMRLMSLQLFHIVKKKYLNHSNICKINSEDLNNISWPPSFPNITQKQIIRTFFISSFIDHVAVRNEGNLLSKFSYLISNHTELSDQINIHPNSLLRNIKPKYLIYSQIISTNDNMKHNLCDCVLITPDDIVKATSLKHSLIDCSKILSYPTPYYSLKDDCVFAYCIPKYRNNSIVIDLPSSEIKLDPNSNLSCETFVRSIINGIVFKQFKNDRIINNLKSKSYNKNFKYLVYYLQQNKTCTRNDLLTMFNKKRDFLLKQVLDLYEMSVHNDIRSFWPPI